MTKPLPYESMKTILNIPSIARAVKLKKELLTDPNNYTIEIADSVDINTLGGFQTLNGDRRVPEYIQALMTEELARRIDEEIRKRMVTSRL